MVRAETVERHAPVCSRTATAAGVSAASVWWSNRSQAVPRRSEVAFSLGLDVRGLDDRPPFLDLGLVMSEQCFRRLSVTRGNVLAEVGEALLHEGVGQAFDHRSIEPDNAVLRCVFGDPEPVPERNVES